MKRALPLLLLAACAPSWKGTPHDIRFQRTPAPVAHAQPKSNEPVDWWYAIDHSTARPLAETLSPGYWIDKLRGGTPALDVNAFGQVIDSTWFENRIGKGRLTLDELRRGPNTDDGPAPGKLTVIRGKMEGATPGLVLRDTRGVTFVTKFDPAAYPGLASGAEIITTKVLWAAGYNVPQNHVGFLDTARLELAPDAYTRGEFGRVPLDEARLGDLIAHVNPFADGRARALYSRVLPGRIIGPFAYRGNRHDDPNDVVPHERRRSLRGLWLFAAWLNNVDVRASNTLDVFMPDESGDKGHVVHYLIDFGDSLGSAGTGPKYVGEGYEGRMEWSKVLRSLFSAGLWYRPWLVVQRSPYRSVGVFEAAHFDPRVWRSHLPNPAFDEATWHDMYWAASLISRFTPDALAAIVDEAGYTEAGAKEWILRVLSARQFEILEWVFGEVLALDDPRVEGDEIVLTDLDRECGLSMADEFYYRYSIRWNRTGASDQPLDEGTNVDPRASMKTAITKVRGTNGGDFEADPFLTVRFERVAPAHGGQVEVHLRVVGDRVIPVGVERTTGG